MKLLLVILASAIGLITAVPTAFAQSITADTDPGYDGPAIPESLRGPFISDPRVIARLDCPTTPCDGPLNFNRLIQARLQGSEPQTDHTNPFNLDVAERITEAVQADIKELSEAAGATKHRLHPKFLTYPRSRVELVGVVNRMDRQFIVDSSMRATPEQRTCGEISAIYRFAYATTESGLASRLPVTMNLVFPALPSDTRDGAITCSGVAQRWLHEILREDDRPPEEVAADLMDLDTGPLAFLSGADIERLELNMQVYRKPAGIVKDFGSKAAYLIRVFRWDAEDEVFLPAFMTNQIDRSLLICNGPNDPECDAKQNRRRALVAYLQRKEVVSALEKGELDIPDELGVRAIRAVSISPGGPHRSDNQPFWSAPSTLQDVITNDEIRKALANAESDASTPLSFVKSVDDFRTRLNESTCSGCHQTRAIAGFHFPGADQPGTPRANSVLLPGSPQFYGDQPRRMGILRLMASRPDARLTEYELAVGYAARPLNKFRDILKDTELIGGWGGTCLMDPSGTVSQRQWSCQKDLVCSQPFVSANTPGVGTCVPKSGRQIGDALQLGKVESTGFGNDTYRRESPTGHAQLIPASALPPSPGNGNSHYGAHQEYFLGQTDCPNLSKADRRDLQTGGFPAGMLRLSECIGLPEEATCGLIASSGFNACIGAVASGSVKVPFEGCSGVPQPSNPNQPLTVTLQNCFETFTSYAGMRACDASAPCRDDYICVRSIGYNAENGAELFDKRTARLETNGFLRKVTGRSYDPTDFGQRMPDAAWLARDDRRGLCIPPYFVFQFRADGHPAPPP